MYDEKSAAGSIRAEEKINIEQSVPEKWAKLLSLASQLPNAPILFLSVENQDAEIYDNGSKYGINEYRTMTDAVLLEEIIKKLARLIHSDAFKGMISDAALTVFPVKWPSGKTFGALCMLGNGGRAAELNKRLIEQYAGIITDDLAAAVSRSSYIELSELNTSLENEMKKSAQRFLDLFDKNPAVQIALDLETGLIADANLAALQFYGYSREEIIGRHVSILSDDPSESILDSLRQAYKQAANNLLDRHRRKDGSVRDVNIFGIPIMMENKMYMSLMIYDITEKMQIEKELKKSERLFRLVAENAPDAIFVQTEYKFTYVNNKTITLFGAASESELIGKNVVDYFAASYKEQVKRRMRTLNIDKKEVRLKEETILRLDGGQVDVEVSAAPFNYYGKDGALVYMRDITERKQLEKEKLEMEAQLRQKQRLESIGTLAGGVAHEINNPVNGIINYAQLIADTPELSGNVAEYSAEIIRESQRIAEIVKNLLTFARQEKQILRPERLDEIVSETLSLIRTVLRHDQIVLKVNVPKDLPEIKCRSQQIQQVIMNLITNARDALNEKYEGPDEDKVILLECSAFERDGASWVKLVVEDHGTGIAPDIMEKIADPFVTTKPQGEGTGLGLSISHGIVKDHNGELFFESEPGAYTRAIMELPAENEWPGA